MLKISQAITSNRFARCFIDNSVVTSFATAVITLAGMSHKGWQDRGWQDRKQMKPVQDEMKKFLAITDKSVTLKTETKLSDLDVKNSSAIGKRVKTKLAALRKQILSVWIAEQYKKTFAERDYYTNYLKKYSKKNDAIVRLIKVCSNKGSSAMEVYEKFVAVAALEKPDCMDSTKYSVDEQLYYAVQNQIVEAVKGALEGQKKTALKSKIQGVDINKELAAIYNGIADWKSDLLTAIKWAAGVGLAFYALLYGASTLSTRNIVKQ